MRKRMLLMLGIAVVFIAAIGSVKFLQIRAAIAQGMAWQPPPEAVTTVVAGSEQWSAKLSSIGSVTAVHGVTVSADLPGTVEEIDFDSGRKVRAGELLVRLDTHQEEAQLVAAQAQRDLARLDLERSTELFSKGVIARADHDRIVAQAKTAEARVKEIEAAIRRKTIRAPFSGVLGLRQADLGQYLTGGSPIVPLQSMDPIYVEFAVPQQDVGALRIGAEVTASVDSVSRGEIRGRVTAINSVVDVATRNVQVQATFRNPGGVLRPGMFVDVEVDLGRPRSVVALPASAISYAPYGNSVFIVGEMKDPKGGTYRGVRQEFVKLGAARGDQIAILSGVSPGEEVVTSGVFKLRNGAAVLVNNERQPSNDLAPKPEDS